MQFNLPNQELIKVKKLIEIKERNIEAAEIYIDYLTNLRDSISKEEIQKRCKKYNCNETKAFYYSFLDVLGIQKNSSLYKQVNENSKIDSLIELNPNEFINNPYYKNIKFQNKKIKNWELTNLNYLEYEGFVYDELNIDENYRETTPFGFFKNEFKFPAVIEDDTIWMSVTPHEINTMKDSISKATGNVIVVGLGLGYFAYMISLKENVHKITIIEKDKKVIDLFNSSILPQFENKSKIEIINIDAYRYFDTNTLNEYNFCFFDIWHNVGDGEELYLMMKSRENDHKNIQFEYWIEPSILSMLRRQILLLIEEELDGKDDSFYKEEYGSNDRIINGLHFLLKNVKITKAEDLKRLLTEQSLKQIAKKLNYLELFI